MKSNFYNKINKIIKYNLKLKNWNLIRRNNLAKDVKI